MPMAQDQVEVMERLEYDHFLIVGHDCGGRISMAYLSPQPQVEIFSSA
jgi:pimeloyl-ACP methyl ester carboxylesterase